MSDRNDFDFDDDFLDDDNEPFDFDEEEGFPSGLGDDFESDMPVIEEESERGPNRAFVLLAGVMILLFVAALVVVLYLATRDTGPSDSELTITAVVMQNLTVEAYAAQTATQNALNVAMTQTAAAWTATPTITQTATATEFRPTITPTPTQDLTQLALAELGANALTLTALAGQATATPEPTEPAPTEVAAAELDLRSAFATQVAFATQQGQFDQGAFATRVFAATQIADAVLDAQTEAGLREQLEATQSALSSQSDAVMTAIAFIDQELAVRGVENPALATALAIVVPSGLETQSALVTPFAQATANAQQTQAALGTLIADLDRNTQATPGAAVPSAPDTAKVNEAVFTRAEVATQVAMLPPAQAAETATAAVLATRESFATQAAVATRSSLSTQAALATQQAFLTPPIYATQAAVATQVALATRQALIDMALGLLETPTPGGAGIDAVNQTATAIAGAFLTATAQAFTPGAPTMTAVPVQQAFPTALPETGLFEDMVSGGRNGIGILALTVIGLVGVIFVSRRLRAANERTEMVDTTHAPPRDQEEPPKVE